MKQAQYSPLTNAEIVCVIYAGTAGFLDKVAVKDVGRFEAGLLAYLRGQRKDILDWITNSRSEDQGCRRAEAERRDRRFRQDLSLERPEGAECPALRTSTGSEASRTRGRSRPCIEGGELQVEVAEADALR